MAKLPPLVAGRARSVTRSSPASAEAGLDVTIEAAIVDTLRQVFPDAQVTIGSDVAAVPGADARPTVVASQSSTDPVVRLEKLAALHASGIIDDVQFAALRAQILEQAGLG